MAFICLAIYIAYYASICHVVCIQTAVWINEMDIQHLIVIHLVVQINMITNVNLVAS